MQLLHLFENHKNLKRFVNLTKIGIFNVITLEIIINSLSGRMFKNVTVKFFIFSQSLFKNSYSLLTQIYAMQDSGNSLIKRSSAVLTEITSKLPSI